MILYPNWRLYVSVFDFEYLVVYFLGVDSKFLTYTKSTSFNYAILMRSFFKACSSGLRVRVMLGERKV